MDAHGHQKTYKTVLCSIISYSQKLQMTQTSIKNRMKKDVVYSYSGILCRNGNKQSTNNMDKY